MRLPLTRYGLPQVLVYPLLDFTLMVILFVKFRPAPFLFPIEAVLLALFVWMLSFFRDPRRNITLDEQVLLSPADGTITDITQVDGILFDKEGNPVRSLMIGVFLSIFNVHINRAPCSVRIEKVTYKKGRFKNAMSTDAGRLNESNDILMVRQSDPSERILVRQISGAIARHIVCEAMPEEEYRQGQPFGMIKFGSRAEVYIGAPEDAKYQVLVKTGDPVRAGLTPLIRYGNESTIG